jgi:mRNA interferase MazF
MVMPAEAYVPDRGDIVWLQFDPQAGHEQSGRRPALVISPKAYNAKAGLALFCPITAQAKGYPFECQLPESGRIQGAILSDHIKSLDWRARDATLVERAQDEVIGAVTALVLALVDPERH